MLNKMALKNLKLNCTGNFITEGALMIFKNSFRKIVSSKNIIMSGVLKKWRKLKKSNKVMNSVQNELITYYIIIHSFLN